MADAVVDTGPIVVDFEGVSTGFEPLDEGWYDAHIGSWKQFIAKSSGNKVVEVTFTLDEHKGRKAWRNYTLTPESLWAIKKMLVDIGVDEKRVSSKDTPLHEILNEVIGAPVKLKITRGEYEGKPKNDVAEVTGPLAAASGKKVVTKKEGF